MAAPGSLAIVDTRCANLASVVFAFGRLGVQPLVTADPAELRAAERVLLPGVGTAGAAMRELERLGLPQVLRSLRQPVLGICLGMQLLTRESEESAQGGQNQRCLGVVDAATRRMEADGLSLPHMGWNRLEVGQPSPLLAGLDGAYVYYVHGYAVPRGPATLAQTTYGQPFSAVLAQGNFYGAQFHPERSGPAGARLLRNFLELEAGRC
ncbi:Imidazole glycerol phosphate synthase subunit hisH (plasmid) [Deinococcus proteolyticus MRP]|uniref:Imidazole glycerol phosphate synthase subunit HisH n=1 Tax=Deinococcus proteolyticus (strain ATCC 35074 / DSM 20540 / JCM 6276 / NBRC 101906 / NCIMB 13154 / VKM Ac-1939 / CCM 2703 / MRP) TaxID=693977 RepID=F0RQ10_DEIPM|nr:imidazole glycerol phosphate synthase subunit HisH [Deinococcus proteolyticus]ADY27212.1 Imidazole glycerol phosphate synthase subunit hisH [Deinococcus proteolyticus MRP]